MVNFFSIAIIATSILSVTVATPVKRTTADVLAAIAKVSTDTHNLDNLITSYPLSGGSLLAALSIHTSAGTLGTDLGTATTAANNNGPVAHPDADSILAAVLAIEPTIDHALSQIVVKHPAFAALPIGGIPALVHSDLIALKGSTGNFANSLIANAPTDLKDDGTAYRDRLLAAFDVAIAAYA
ncbi:hypothetical protein D9756_009511 [Leucocoprinus leucothites]|uniref:Uncharacterized protein n=1 Tax=Leucocoprinus leucothites TaxID=201217 RepID=A0A8H5CW50_9AGAR|nr:hypothetical protein D9756_009511 [Leucoagaricus leucothites]